MDQNPRTRTVAASSRGALDISAIVLLSVLLAAGFILNFTLGNALAITGIKPQFIIAAYSLAILLTRANLTQSVLYGLISAAVIQLSTSVPGLKAKPILDIAVGLRTLEPAAALRSRPPAEASPRSSPASPPRWFPARSSRGWAPSLWGPLLLPSPQKSPLCWARPYSMLSWYKRCTPR